MVGFPIFIDVAGAPPLVVGGGELALVKVRLLLKRAQTVVVAADRIVTGMRDLVEHGRVLIIAPSPGQEMIRGRPFVISATENDVEDVRVSRLARELGVPVNVPDRPNISTFSLPAIVDRGTVTIAIGTEGAAPVLATRLRTKLEAELHPLLGKLADVACEYRGRVAESIRSAVQRRQFWDRIFGGIAAEAILQGDEARGRRLIDAELSESKAQPEARGRVVLVGAGPGDPDLLTLKAVRALKSADVVVHDGLMGAAVLEHARREARLISVAKARGHHSRTQAEINALMIALAREGKTVVRLKGGDPSIFGRSGEEIDALRAAAISVEVIPGITTATAAAASLQIPLTHRNFAHSLTFLSGHSAKNGDEAFEQVDFGALADRQATLAVYMGLSIVTRLAKRLIDAGWSPAMPVLAVSRVSQPGERRLLTSLDALIASDAPLPLSGPTLLLIGEVASLNVAGPVQHLDRVANNSRLEHLTDA